MKLNELPWLVTAPADIRHTMRSLSAEDAGERLQEFATYNLSAQQSVTFGKLLSSCLREGTIPASLSKLKLGILSNATIDLVAEQLPAGAARHGVALEVVIPPYDQVQQQALDPDSETNSSGLDAVLLAVDHRWFQLEKPNLQNPQGAVDAAIGRLSDTIAALKDHSKAELIVQTLPIPPLPLLGSSDIRSKGSPRAMCSAFNDRLVELAEQTGVVIFDVATLAERVGTDQWFDQVQWAAFKLPFSSEIVPAYADAIGALFGAMRGKSRKCLVLDLDNTVWGGVIGDDGMNGIKIGQGSAVGEGHMAVQEMALALRERGIMLAVSSKNDDHTAREPFKDHPDMLLRENHITVFQANWTDKANNLEAIAKTINIGLDSLVFLDDNPAERAQMRAALPMVAVPELPADPNLYPAYLASANYFEALSFSNEDKLRVQSYASEAKRAEVKAKSRDLGEYLKSLEMVIQTNEFDDTGRARIAQLINKTNQFNLTTKRYTENEVETFQKDLQTVTLQFRLTDSFAEFGMIGVIIAKPVAGALEPTLEIDTWLMSCRVLGRKVEAAMLENLVAQAREQGIARLLGVYRATPKNGMVKEHYLKLGFSENGSDADGNLLFELEVNNYVSPELPVALN